MTFKAKLLNSTKGAGATEYAILVGLLGVVAIGTVLSLGLETRDTFSTANATLQQGIAGNGNSNGNGNSASGNCFVETGADSSNTFIETDPYNCFEISNGNDILSVTKNGQLSVTAANGEKNITLGGTGPHTVALSDVPTSTVNQNSGTLTGINAAADVTSTGGIDVAGTGASTGSWSFALDAGDDTISLSNARISQGDFGNGANTLTMAAGAANTVFAPLYFGTGANTMNMACQDPTVDWVNNLPYSVENVGAMNATLTGCPLYFSSQPFSSQTGDANPQGSVSIVSTQPSSTLSIGQRAGYNNFSFTGTVSGSTTITLESMDGRQTGPATVDLDMTADHLSNGPNGPRALTTVRVEPDLAQSFNGPDRPSAQNVNINLDVADLVAAGADSYLATELVYTTANQSVTYTGGGTARRYIGLGFTDPATYPNSGVPSLSSDTPVRLTVRTKGCWAVTVHAKAGSGFSDVTHPAGNCTYSSTVNTPIVSANMSSYEGATLFAPSGATFQLGFNGGPWTNGNTLTLETIVFGAEQKDDTATPGGGA